MNNDKLIKKFDKQAGVYQRNIENPTLAQWRRKIIPHAYGDVLEVGVGAGANFPYYKRDNVHVVGVDFSPKMIETAKQTAYDYQINSEFIQSDVERLHFEPNSFDCVVSTLTLCGYPDPLKTLNQFNSWCKPGGKVLLMEHGLSSNAFLSGTMKVINPIFKRVSGCHCNRNIEALLANSHLEIERIERYWQGIIHLIWAKPTK